MEDNLTLDPFKVLDTSEKENILYYVTTLKLGFEHSFYIIKNNFTDNIRFSVYITDIITDKVIWSNTISDTTITYCLNYTNTIINEAMKPNHVSDNVLN